MNNELSHQSDQFQLFDWNPCSFLRMRDFNLEFDDLREQIIRFQFSKKKEMEASDAAAT